jgi:putative ATP-dependent endonuclease of the OLD family
MRLHSLKIEGFRRIREANITFGDTTFLIGANNCGKSTVLRAIKSLLSVDKRLDSSDFFSVSDPETHETKIETGVATIEATFRNLPEEARNWRGFKGRIALYDVAGDTGESGLSITYRKTYTVAADVVIEMKSKARTIKEIYARAEKPQELIEAGCDSAAVEAIFDTLDKKIKASEKHKLYELDEIWDFSDDDIWETNPGGIPGVVISKLPSFLLIPAESAEHEINSKTGVLCQTLNELFEDVRNTSTNYAQAKTHLEALAQELDPTDNDSEFGKMLAELNRIVGGIFPESKLHATADLTGPNTLKPSFSIEMSSNIRTSVSNQGTGMIRSAVFGILRFRQKWLSGRTDNPGRALIIGFEEPELYLHPSAANQMRDTIYDLSTASSQIVATSHSPFMIDLSKKPRQIINRFYLSDGNVAMKAFTATDAFKGLQDDDKTYVKMILKIDDHIARIFFTSKVIIVEGDTEDIVIRESLARLPETNRQKVRSSCEVIKARGKASIIGISKYLVAMGIIPTIIHDRDQGTAGAEVFNEPIAQAAEGGIVVQLENCIEDVLGYPAPTSEKPLKAYQRTLQWANTWPDIPGPWRAVMRRAFEDLVPE